jgi:hypothetical protein
MNPAEFVLYDFTSFAKYEQLCIIIVHPQSLGGVQQVSELLLLFWMHPLK